MGDCYKSGNQVVTQKGRIGKLAKKIYGRKPADLKRMAEIIGRKNQ